MLENHRNIKDMIWNTLDNWPTYKDVLLVILQAARLYMFPEMLFWQWYDRDYYLTIIIRNPQKAGLPSAFNGFRKAQRSWMFSPKTVQSLKKQHFIRLCLKTPTVDIAPVKLYPYVKKQDANSNAWACVLLLPVPAVPLWHIVYLWSETVETSGFFA